MSAERERALVERLCESRPPRVLVASDFHLCEGWDPVTTTCISTENFLADETFGAWLTHYAPQAHETLLILNGDTFDVVRVTKVPETPEDFERWSQRLGSLGRRADPADLAAAVEGHESRYGLKTDDYKTVWKLMVTVDGHWRFFDALAAWVQHGGRVLFMTGNHDVELHWQLVRDWLRSELTRRGADDVADRVAFVDSGVALGDVWVEHGHMYDAMTKVDGGATLPPHHTQINLPLGSFINRYFINRIEALDPFIDNVKPVQSSLLRLARQRPLKILSTYAGGWKFVRKAIAKRQMNRSVLTIGLLLAAPLFAPLLLLAIPGIRETVLGWLPIGGAGQWIATALLGLVFAGALPYLLGVISDLRRRRPATDHHVRAATERARRQGEQSGRNLRYVCMGHTHVSAVKQLDAPGHPLYINTGTWIALWPRDRPDLLGRTVFTYAVFERDQNGGYEGRTLEWDAHAERPRAATILVPAAA